MKNHKPRGCVIISLQTQMMTQPLLMILTKKMMKLLIYLNIIHYICPANTKHFTIS